MLRRLINVFAVLGLISSMIILPSSRALADFNHNDIIDDGVFSNTGSMSTAQINNFLNQFSSSCISQKNGFTAPDPTGYSSAAGYTYGGNVSGGQVIYDAAQAYGVNPQVLIATLQKESSVISGDASYHCQYINTAMGYGCPDSGSCPTNPATMSGFSKQVIHAAWLMKFGQQRSLGHTNWNVQLSNFPQSGDHWDNSDDPPTCYGGPMTQGTLSRGCGQDAAYFDGYTTIDGSSVHMDSGATAALYWYTPHFSGNQHFDDIFSGWFGSPNGCPNVDSSYIQRLYRFSDDSYLFTNNNVEICQAVKYYGYSIEGNAFQSVAPTDLGAKSVYRLSRNGIFIFTTNETERDMAMQLYGYRYEGVAFYASDIAKLGYYPVYRLSRNSRYVLTTSNNERNAIQGSGYHYEGQVFYSPSPGNKTAIYRLSKNGIHLYTSSEVERDIAKASGYSDEGTAYYALTAPSGDSLPVFRMERSSRRLYTTIPYERGLAIISNYRQETSYFYVYEANYPGTVPIYRLVNPSTGDYLYTSNSTERDQAIQKYGYLSEGVGFNGAPAP
jgi:hypothetical protein